MQRESCIVQSHNSTVITIYILQVSKERVSHEIEQMLRSKNYARAVSLFHYIELVPLILPLPPIENICLATFSESLSNSSTASSTSSSSSSGGDISSVVIEELGDKKKKKKGNNDAEVVHNLSQSDINFIAQSSRDFHSYGCCASLIQALLEISANTDVEAIWADRAAAGGKGSEEHLKSLRFYSFDNICSQMKGFLYHFYKDLSQNQSEETGKILRSVIAYHTYALYVIGNKIGINLVTFYILFPSFPCFLFYSYDLADCLLLLNWIISFPAGLRL
jgi:tRNA nucleotidyltransferase/poly(A) polymerase